MVRQKREIPENAKYSHWTVVEATTGTLGKTICRCKCGDIRPVLTRNLISGKSRQCMRCAGKARPKPVRTPPGYANKRNVFYVYQKKAADRGFAFELSQDELLELTQQDCTYCGAPPGNRMYLKHCNGPAFVYNGIDRQDSTQGYVAGNVVPCCRQCNVAKSNHPLPVFIEWAKRVAAHMVDWTPQET